MGMCRLLSCLVALLLTLAPSVRGDSGQQAAATPECVVLLHGLWRTQLSMKRLQWRLENAGYDVVNVSYPSLIYTIEELAIKAVETGVEDCQSRGRSRIDFVTHSLGGILLREYLALKTVPRVGRVVMLGPPNQGSGLADYIHSLRILRPITPAAVEQLGTGENSLVAQLGPVAFDLGVIAGTKNLTGFLPGFPDGVSDSVVAVTETVVPGMRDFLVLPVSHTFMSWDPAVIEQVVQFLRSGHFDHDGS